MRALLQRVSRASVTVDGTEIAAVGPGLVVLLGIYPDDSEADILWLASKILELRIFPDVDKPMNQNVMAIDGSLLVISQFTLAADVSRGRRPGFSSAAPPGVAEPLYDRFIEVLESRWPKIATGRFGADMQVALVNDGPVTFLVDTPAGLTAG